MKQPTSAYSNLPELLLRNHSSVADLYKRLSAKGAFFDRKTLYRLASSKPVLSVNTAVLKAVCEELRVGIGDVLVWELPQPKLHRIDQEMQDRLSLLMTKNNEGELTSRERKELEILGAEAERLSLENARILAAAVKGRNTGKLQPMSGARTASRPPRAKTAIRKA